MRRTGDGARVVLCLVLGASARRATGGRGGKRVPGRTKGTTGARKGTVGLVLA